MPIDSPCAEYEKASAKWQKCRDVIAGGDAIKGNRVLYVAKPSGMDKDDYNAYIERPEFFNATARTVQGMSGAIMRRPPTHEARPDVEKLFTDVTLNGRALESFAADVLKETMSVGRAGVLVDMPPAGSENQRPYWVLYTAEQIFNWRVVVVDGKRVLRLVVLRECAKTPSPDDPYVMEEEITYRELRLLMSDGPRPVPTGYVQVIWRKVITASDDGTKKEEWVADAPIAIVRRGEALTFIPFVFFNADDNETDISEPPLNDLADVNVSHFRTSCDWEHGAHYTACPTPWAVGVPTQTTLKIGSGTAWILNDGPHSKADMLEYSGQGLGALEALVDRKEKRMAVLGARLLEQQATHVETAEAVRLRQRGDESVMVRLANTVSAGLTRALQWTTWWMGSGKLEQSEIQKAKITLNTDLIEVKMDAPTMTALMGLFQGGAMSFEVLFHNLKQGELIPAGRTLEDEQEAIEGEERKRLDITKEELAAAKAPVIAPAGGTGV
jgi:hypothetical protein